MFVSAITVKPDEAASPSGSAGAGRFGCLVDL